MDMSNVEKNFTPVDRLYGKRKYEQRRRGVSVEGN